MAKSMGPNRRLVQEALTIVVAPDGKHLDGRIRNLNQESICCFLSNAEGTRLSLGMVVSISAAAQGHGFGPVDAVITAAEQSWVTGYDVVLTCKFKDLSPTAANRIDRFIQGLSPRDEAARPAVKRPPAVPYHLKNAEVVQFVFPARFAYVVHFRDACEKLAEEAGFDDFECHQIKVAADELFSNALHHGSEGYGDVRILAKVLLSREGIVLCVRDQLGLPFDHKRYREETPSAGAPKVSGLRLVDKVADDWMVTTEPGKFTLVCIYKRRRTTNKNEVKAS